MKFLYFLLALLAVFGIARGDELVINEFLASNDTSQADQDGDHDDWIELYNGSGSALSLSGFHLSDDPSDLTQWTFPDTVIAAHGYLTVWADEDDDQRGLHANFKLSASGESLYLMDDATDTVDAVTWGTQVTDVSYGRFPDGVGAWRTMYPSFNGPNHNAGPGGSDTTLAVFGDTLIHSINLDFYIEHWQDTLQYNFEVLDQEYLPARLTFDGVVVLDSIGVRYKGHSSYEQSRATPKKPFELDINEYRDQDLMGLKKLNMSNCVNDPSFMRETLAYGLARRLGPAPRTAYANLSINDTLLGFYAVIEQIDKTFLGRYFQDNAANLYKAGDDGTSMEFHGTDPTEYADEYELKTNEEENDWSGLIGFLNVLNNTSDARFPDSIQARLNVDGCLRFLALNMVMSNFDSYTGSGRNFYLYDDRVSGQMQFMPWDFNESFGVYSNGFDVFTQDAVTIPNLAERPLTRRLLAVDSLRTVYLSYIRQLIDGPAHADTIAAMTARLRPVIQASVLADTNKLYTDAAFSTNIESNVFVGIGHLIPGLTSFARIRNANLRLQVSTNRVYPGDTDNNGIVNALDVLPIARYFLQTGAVRDSAAFSWNPCRAVLWTTAAATYADGGGDGRVDEHDVLAIGINWQNSHAANSASFEIDPVHTPLSTAEAAHLRTIYHSLSGASQAVLDMKSLMASLLTDEPAPAEFALAQNYPNPFNQGTLIAFSLPQADRVTLTVLNLLGQVVAAPIAAEQRSAGTHSLYFDAAGLTSGVYFYRLQTGQGSRLHKMVILR
jgi:hypothetical protein